MRGHSLTSAPLRAPGGCLQTPLRRQAPEPLSSSSEVSFHPRVSELCPGVNHSPSWGLSPPLPQSWCSPPPVWGSSARRVGPPGLEGWATLRPEQATGAPAFDLGYGTRDVEAKAPLSKRRAFWIKVIALGAPRPPSIGSQKIPEGSTQVVTVGSWGGARGIYLLSMLLKFLSLSCVGHVCVRQAGSWRTGLCVRGLAEPLAGGPVRLGVSVPL